MNVVPTCFIGQDQLEVGVVDEFVNFGQIFLVINLFHLKDEFEELKVEDGFVAMRLVHEKFDGPILIHQIFVEKGRVLLGLGEDGPVGRMRLRIILQLAEFPLVLTDHP